MIQNTTNKHEHFNAGDVVEVTALNDPEYEPFIGTVYYDNHNKGWAVQSFERGPVLSGDYDNPNPQMHLS